MSERWPAKPAKGVPCMAMGCSAEAVETCLRADAYKKRQEDRQRLQQEGGPVDRALMKAALQPLCWTPSFFLCEDHVLSFELNGMAVRNPKRKMLSLRSVTMELQQIRAALA